MHAPKQSKSLVKKAFKKAIRLWGKTFPASSVQNRILTYHSVGFRTHDMNVSPKEFRLQMQWLAAHATVISLNEALEGKKGVVITFDDGYYDNLLHAAPILQEFNLPATLFMVAGCAGETIHSHEDPQQDRLLSWEELQRIESMGFDIGAHTLTHPHLSHLPPEEQQIEIEDAKTTLEAHLNHPIDTFAYPYGASSDYDETTKNLVRNAGYCCALSNRYGPNHSLDKTYELRRIWIDATDDLETFQAKVNGELDLLRLLDTPLGLYARTLLNRLTR